MRIRLNFKHLVICFGMSGFIAYSSAQAAPHCSQIFAVNSITDSEAIAILDNLAELKFQLDQARLNGGMTTAQRILSPEFQKRFEEVYEYYQGTVTKEEFKDLLRLRIQKMQNKEVVEREIREQREALESDMMPYERFSMERRQPGMIPQGLTYIPALEALLIQGHRGLEKFDLKTQTSKVVLEEIPVFYRVNGEKVFFVTDSGEYASRDMNTGSQQVHYHNVFEKNDKDFRKAFSTDGSWVALLNNYSASLTVFSADSSAAKKIKVLKEPGIIAKYLVRGSDYEYITRLEFVNSHDVLLFTSRSNVILMNLETGSKVNIDWPWNDFPIAHQMRVTSDGYLILLNFRKMGVVKVSDLPQMKNAMKMKEYENWVQEVVKINRNTLIAKTFAKSDEFYSINLETMAASEEPIVSKIFQVSNDVMAEDPQGKRFFIGGWHRLGNKPGDLKEIPMIDIYTPEKINK